MRSGPFSKNKILILILALVIMADFFLQQKINVYANGDFGSETAVTADTTDTSEVNKDTTDIRKVIEKCFAKISINDEIIENAGSSECDWLAFSVGRYTDAYGKTDEFGNLDAYREALCGYVSRKYAENGTGLHRSKATEWHRISLAMLACGGNPEDSASGSDGSVINLIADGTYNCVLGEPWRQGVNGAVYALITLDALNCKVPEDARYDRDDMIGYIISQELETGGFALSGSRYDTDVTAMVVQALAGYYDSRDDVRGVIDRSLACLQDGFGNNAAYGNAASTAQVLLALVTLGIDVTSDERFITEDGKNIIDGIMSFYDEDEAMFCLVKNTGPGFMATTQCLYALTGWCRYNDGFGRLYDFVSSQDNPEKPRITQKPEVTQKPNVTQKPQITSRPQVTQKPEMTEAPIQTEMPDKGIFDEEVKGKYNNTDNSDNVNSVNNANDIAIDYVSDVDNKSKKERSKNSIDKIKKAKLKKSQSNNTNADKTKDSKNTYINIDDKNRNIKTKYNKKENQNLNENDRKKSLSAHNVSNDEVKVKEEDKDNDIIIDREEAYVTEQELGMIIETDRNILINSLLDDSHGYSVTINGADVKECAYMNLKVSNGSGNASCDRNIMEMAPDAFIFNAAGDRGIACEALYSIETELSDGDYLLMRYSEDGVADYVNKVSAEGGIIRAVIDKPGIYFACKEVKVKKIDEAKDEVKVKGGVDDVAVSADGDVENGVHIIKYIAGAVLVMVFAAVCILIYLKVRGRDKGNEN